MCGRSSDGHSIHCYNGLLGLRCAEFDSNNQRVGPASPMDCSEKGFDNDGWDRNGNAL